MSADYTPTEVALDDRLWRLYLRGLSEGMRLSYEDGYRAGCRDTEAAEVAQWSALREDMQQRARDFGVRQRRGGDPHAVAHERQRRGWTP